VRHKLIASNRKFIHSSIHQSINFVMLQTSSPDYLVFRVSESYF